MTPVRPRPNRQQALRVGKLHRYHAHLLWEFDDDTIAVREFLREVDRHPALSHEEQLQLVYLAQAGDAKARERLLTSNIRLLMAVAHEYVGLGLPSLDLISEGMIGMEKALRLFKPDLKAHFTTYALWWIKQCMIKALVDRSLLVRLPSHIHAAIHRLRKAERRLLTINGQVTPEDLQRHLRVSDHALQAWRTFRRNTISLQQPIGPGSTETIGDTLVGNGEAEALYEVWQDRFTSSLQRIQAFQLRWHTVRHVTQRDRELFIARFGLSGREPLKLAVVGEAYGVTRERARQIEKKVLKHLYPSLDAKQARHEVALVYEAICVYYDQARGAQIQWHT